MMSSLSIRLCVRTVSNTLSADAHTDAIAIVINPIATSLRPTSRNRNDIHMLQDPHIRKRQ